ncbi:MAG: hypothetical protein MZU97_02100 [Bacillus subtilis]|nr:hypothetical protein [Bacillus subtilis]
MATLSTNNENNNIIESKARETLFNNVTELISRTNSSTIELNKTAESKKTPEIQKAQFKTSPVINSSGAPISHKIAADNFMIIKKYTTALLLSNAL